MTGKTLTDLSFSNGFFPKGSKIEIRPVEELANHVNRHYFSGHRKHTTLRDCVMVIFEDDQTKQGRIIQKKDIKEVK